MSETVVPSHFTKLNDRAAAPSALYKAQATGTPSDIVKKLLGNKIECSTIAQPDIDLREGYPHTTTGIPQQVHGTATVVQVGVAEHLASYNDPIKAILPAVQFTAGNRIIVKRKYVVGGGATITPERAPARTVAIQEDSREIVLTRYGGDIELNLNLFLRPDDAKEELDMKVEAQKRELERALTMIGYETIMAQGTDLADAILRSNPTYSGGTPPNVAMEAVERIMFNSVFGAMAKFAYPVLNLMAAAKYASVYNTTQEVGSVLLLPHGCPEMLRYTHKEEMTYAISGVAKSGRPAVDMPLNNVYYDPSVNVKIVVHVPQPTNDFGAANGYGGRGGLTEEVSISAFYDFTCDEGFKAGGESYIVDFSTGDWALLPEGIRNSLTTGDKDRIFVVRPKMKLMMSSAVLAVPGKNTGELLVGYPFTGVSTSQVTETLLVKLRAYLGAAIYRPENILVMRHVAFEGCTGGYDCSAESLITWDFTVADASIMAVMKKPVLRVDDILGAIFEKQTNIGTIDEATTKTNLRTMFGLGENEFDDTFEFEYDGLGKKITKLKYNYTSGRAKFDAVIPRGASKFYPYKDGALQSTPIERKNLGHLGCVDHPSQAMAVWGTAGGQVYKGGQEVP
jgi:hypothetical protein